MSQSKELSEPLFGPKHAATSHETPTFNNALALTLRNATEQKKLNNLNFLQEILKQKNLGIPFIAT